MGTLGKAVGSAGGYVCGSRSLIDFLVQSARSLIFSTAPGPAQSAAALAGVRMVRSDEGALRCRRVWELVDHLKHRLIHSGWTLTLIQSAIVPVLVGSEESALRLSDQLRQNGFFGPAIRYPTVPRGEARLRLTITARHQPVEIDGLVQALSQESQEHHASS